jgi:ribosomal protein L12E/L44/L45/RPP1/RPP2
MDEQEEHVAIDTVVDRIAARFPTVEREHIRSLVDAEAATLDDAQVRDFIPVLVEHHVMEQLRAIHEPAPLDDAALADRLSGADEAGASERAESEPEELDPYERESLKDRPGLLNGEIADN